MSPQIRRRRIRVIEEKSRNRRGVRLSKTFFPPLNSHPPSVPWRALFWLLSLFRHRLSSVQPPRKSKVWKALTGLHLPHT